MRTSRPATADRRTMSWGEAGGGGGGDEAAGEKAREGIKLMRRPSQQSVEGVVPPVVSMYNSSCSVYAEVTVSWHFSVCNHA